jgi:hypothetical protein
MKTFADMTFSAIRRHCDREELRPQLYHNPIPTNKE